MSDYLFLLCMCLCLYMCACVCACAIAHIRVCVLVYTCMCDQYKYVQGSQPRTTFILLCEDGSLRIYLANNNDNNHCWLHPLYQPSRYAVYNVYQLLIVGYCSPLASLKFKARKKSKHQGDLLLCICMYSYVWFLIDV